MGLVSRAFQSFGRDLLARSASRRSPALMASSHLLSEQAGKVGKRSCQVLVRDADEAYVMKRCGWWGGTQAVETGDACEAQELECHRQVADEDISCLTTDSCVV